MKVLVTGGMGYIGSHTVIELLKSKKFKVISADSCERSTPETASRIELITGEKVMNYPVDIAEKESFFKIFEENPDVEAIIHFAAYKSVPESVAKPLLY